MNHVEDTGGDRSADQLQALMALLASVNGEMITVADEVRKQPAVTEVRRGCDFRKYRDAFRFDDKAFYAFETYVEADTRDGSLLCWLVDVNWTPAGWELNRTATCQSDSSEDVIMEFPMVSSDSFLEFAGEV